MSWFPAVIAVAAIAATYFFCIRPALRGRCAMGAPPASGGETGRQLAELQEELRILRAQDSLDRSGAPPGPRHAAPPDA